MLVITSLSTAVGGRWRVVRSAAQLLHWRRTQRGRMATQPCRVACAIVKHKPAFDCCRPERARTAACGAVQRGGPGGQHERGCMSPDTCGKRMRQWARTALPPSAHYLLRTEVVLRWHCCRRQRAWGSGLGFTLDPNIPTLCPGTHCCRRQRGLWRPVALLRRKCAGGRRSALSSKTQTSAVLQAPVGPWGGLWRSCDADDLAADAVRLHADQTLWEGCVGAGARALPRLYDAGARLGAVRAAIEGALADLSGRRARDYVGGLLWQQSARATDFFARWVELKERKG